ncbi:hypothetical protein RSAG8_08398, partial [Rhizoctonia solani AG-8 WAC10335]
MTQKNPFIIYQWCPYNGITCRSGAAARNTPYELIKAKHSTELCQLQQLSAAFPGQLNHPNRPTEASRRVGFDSHLRPLMH